MISQRCMMCIAADSQGRYFIEINWSGGASENTRWSFVGTFDSETGEMFYSGSRTEELYTDGGKIQTTDIYKNGTGRLFIRDDGMLYWNDYKEDIGKGCIFEKL